MGRLGVIKCDIINSFPNITFVDESYVDDLTLTFKGLYQTDYYYVILVSKYADFIHIGAKLINQPRNQYFWHIDYNFIDDSISESDVYNVIIENLRILVHHKTRIIQKKCLLRQIFILEYLKDDNWIEHRRNNGLRFSDLMFPEIEKLKKVYT